jgi:hypothetical protein
MADTQERDALAACPCCGGDANFMHIEEPTHENCGGHFIECSMCGLSTGLRFACGDDPKPLLAETWNRRAASPAAGVTQPLTDEQIDGIANDGMRNVMGGIYATRVHDFARAIEAEVLAATPPAGERG